MLYLERLLFGTGDGGQPRPRVRGHPAPRHRPPPSVDDPRLRARPRRGHPGVHEGFGGGALRHRRAGAPTSTWAPVGSSTSPSPNGPSVALRAVHGGESLSRGAGHDRALRVPGRWSSRRALVRRGSGTSNSFGAPTARRPCADRSPTRHSFTASSPGCVTSGATLLSVSALDAQAAMALQNVQWPVRTERLVLRPAREEDAEADLALPPPRAGQPLAHRAPHRSRRLPRDLHGAVSPDHHAHRRVRRPRDRRPHAPCPRPVGPDRGA